MIEIIKKEFENLYKQSPMIVVFYTPECQVCTKYLQELTENKKIDDLKKKMFLANCDEDVDYYYKEHNLDDMPCTRLYVNGIVRFERTGILYDFQFMHLRQTLSIYD